MHVGKTLRRPGATPPWPAFSRPKFGGVAPGLHRGTVNVFCPRACRNVFDLECREEAIPITQRRRS